MSRGLPFWYSDKIEFYNSANLKLPDAEEQISDVLKIHFNDNQHLIENWRKCFFAPTPIEINVKTEPSMATAEYCFSLKNAIFIMLLLALTAILIGINNYKTATYILLGLSVIAYFATMSIQNTYIRKSISDAICLPYFEGEAQVLHNQMIWMNDADMCPACGTKRTEGSNVCQNCGIKLPDSRKPKPLNDTFTAKERQRS